MAKRPRGPRAWLAAGACAVALLVLLDTAGWWWLTGRMMAQLAAWQAAQRAAGTTVAVGPVARAGWPVWAELTLAEVSVATGPNQAFAWQAAGATLVSRPWDPDRLDILLDGQQTLRVGGATPVHLAVDRLDVSLAVGSGVVTLEARGAVVPLDSGRVTADAVSLRLGRADAQLAVAGLDLPTRALAGRTLPFGGRVAWLELHASWNQPVPALRDAAASLAAWRDAGGRLTLDGLSLRWGKLDAGGHAVLGLDANLQPDGGGLVRLTGAGEAVDALVRSGTMTRNEGRVATTVLGLLSSPGPDGVPQAELPVSLHDRVLAVGNSPVLRVPALALP